MSEFDPRDYWEARLTKHFGLQGVGHIGLGKNYNNWLYRVRGNAFSRFMKSLAKSTNIVWRDVEVLDVGSGTGFYIDKWKGLGVKKVIGTDIASVAVEALKRKYPDDEFYRVDIGEEQNCLGDRKFDIISAFDVLFHVTDDQRFQKAVENIYSMLKPGGLFVFSDNFLRGGTIRAPHQVNRSLSEIEQVLTAAGFKIGARKPMSILMSYPVDTPSHTWQKFWLGMARIVSIHEAFGYGIGAMLYPLESVCVSLVKESPTTEMMLCKKSSAG